MNIDKYPSDNWTFVGWKKAAGQVFQVWKKQNNPQWLILGTDREEIVHTDPIGDPNETRTAGANLS